MTLKEFKNSCEELKQLNKKVNEISNDNDLSKNEQNRQIALIKPRIDELHPLITKYVRLFNTTTNDFAKQLKLAFEKDYPGLKISVSNMCEGKYYEKEYFEGIETFFTGKTYVRLAVEIGGKEKIIKLLENTTSTDKNNDIDFLIGNNKMNITRLYRSLLNNSTIKFSNTIEKACWNIAEENHKRIYATKITPIEEKRKSLICQRFEIVDEISRLKKINSLSEEIDTLTKKIDNYSNDCENVKIDEFKS